MKPHRTTCRVIYGDTDKMGVAYHANYLRWFEMGRTEVFRSWGLTYRELESREIFLPVSEAFCKFMSPAQYDDVISIETRLDPGVRGGMKFDYAIFSEGEKKALARGYTKHACLNGAGRVIRPPRFLAELIEKHSRREPGAVHPK